MTELDEAADIDRETTDGMGGIDPIHFPAQVGQFDHARIVAAVRLRLPQEPLAIVM